MKRLLLAALITLSLPGFSRTYFTSPTGNDNNAGTITAPFKTLVKAWSVVAAGDTIYMRGGTHAYDHMQYLQAKNGTAGNPIRLWAYPGETPVITRSASYAVVNGVDQDLIYCEGNYLHWKNLEIANFSQKPGETPYPAVRFGYTNNSIFENLKYHDNMAAFSVRGASSNNLFLNSDFYRNQDPYGSDGAGTDAFDGADGLQMNFVSGTNNVIRGCRAWWNADDGFDVWENNGYVLFDSCWAFWNGYIPGTFNTAGNGSGIKLGQTASNRTTLLRTVQNCIAHRNRSFGIVENAADCRSNIYNNTVSQNGVYGFWFGAWNAAVATMVNNISFNNTNDIATHDIQTTNSWQNGRVVNSADFASIDDTQLNGARAANGSLPAISFLKLVTGSDLINVGTGVGIPYNPSAPDLGAFEFGSITPNQSPIANAGADKTITLPTLSITQTGSGTDPDGSIVSYQWTKISGPTTFTIVSPTLATTLINIVLQGVYQFELQVTDNLGATARDTMTLTVNALGNQSPTANAGANQTITLPVNTVNVAGSGNDPDGSIASYLWTKISGPTTFTIVSSTQASTAINNLVQGTYQFELRVTDLLGATGRDTMNVVVNAANIAPTANAGADQSITLPLNSVTVTGSGTDPDGSIASYAWAKISGPATFTIVSPATAQTVINSLTQGVYIFSLTVTDNAGATGIDYITITVNAAGNQSPTANAGANQTINLPVNSLTVTGTGTDPDGSIAFWQWTKIAGPATFNIVSPTLASTAINSLVQGVYQFELRVTDNQGAIARDTMIVTVNAAPNLAPVANAGADQIITLPTSSVSVTGSGTDTDGTIANYQWTKIAGPATFTIVSPALAQTTINNLVQGTYRFELRVTDNLGAIGRDTMTITVNGLPNQPPVANAGADQTITLPANSVTLNGAATDADGSISTYQWTKISGPATFTIASSSTAQTAVNGLIQGIYVFRFTVTDNNGASATDDITVTVNAAPNQAPVANAGTDRNITLPTNSLTVTGNGTDIDGSIASYQWTKISGPATFNIAAPTQAQTLISNLVQGSYQFEFSVTDNLGATGKDTMTIIVNVAPNQSPVASAGIDRTITLPTTSITITGSGTDPDGNIASYQWTKISGPATYTIVSPAQAQTVINNLVQGTYLFELRVTDNLGAIGRDSMIITVNAAANQLPTANAGPNQTITLPTNMVSVTGSGTDPDGSITGYQWTKIAGPAAFILSPNQAQTVISNLLQGTYVFRLTVTDNSGATAEAFVTITVNSISNLSPTANAGNDQTITLPVNSVTVTGTGSDPDGSIASYSWAKISGPSAGAIVNAGQAQTLINSLAQGTYVFSLTVTDNAGATGIDYITIIVNAGANQAPSANAGADQTIILPVNTVTLSGTATDPDGSIVSYLWTKISGPATFSINSPTQAQTSITNLVQGVYVFRLTATDNIGATADAFVTITVNAAPNQLPVANAGSDQSIILPVNTVTLSGSATDPDGSIVSYLWTKISGPATFTLVSPAQAQTLVNNLVQGVYVFRLTATDNSGATADAFVTITVIAAPNLPPVASAGSDRIITLPTNSLTLSGSGFDNDGTIAAYQWNKISGPAQFVILSPTQSQTLVNNLVQGTYQFELRVTDNQGSTGRDTVTVIVNPANNVNLPPVANAGIDQAITLPVNTATLTGSGTDTDGSIASYQWNKIAGPATFTIVTAAQAQTVINNLVQGTYQFELTVTDNLGATGKDTVTITVNPAIAANQPPVVNAGNDQTITLPVNTVNVLGSATDPDGSIAAYQWTKIAGSTSFTIVFPTQPQTTINNLVEGTYQFELRATDNQGATGRDTVTIIVIGAPNLAPVANAGPDRSMTLPTNSITHTGGAIDTDGTISSYLWKKVSGPARFTIVTPDQVQTIFSDLEEGVYEFELAVTDNRGAIDRDTVTVTVKGSGSLIKQAYPNPATNQINVKINGSNARTSLVMHIYDSRGVSVYNKILPVGQPLLSEVVELAKISNGIYIIEVMADGANRSTLKFVKQ